MVVPMSAFSYLIFGLVWAGLGVWMLITSSALFLLVIGAIFVLTGAGAVAGGIWLRRTGRGWLQTY